MIYHCIGIEGQDESRFTYVREVGSQLGAEDDHLMPQVWLHISEINMELEKIETDFMNSCIVYSSMMNFFVSEHRKLRADRELEKITIS